MAQNRNYSSSFEDIISKSDLIHPGPPKVYQLKKKKQKIGSLTSVTVGEKQETKPNKTILLVGETGTGKSTVVNVMVNYAVGVIFEDEIWFQIVEDQTGSQTSDVIVYQIFGSEDQTLPFSLTIIDTPGYGNTQDHDHNTKIKHQLMELFQSADGIQEVHAVGLVMKDGENPVTDRLKYIYDFIKSQFGKDVEKNVVALMTNSHGDPPKNVLQALEAANIKCAKNEKNQPVHFQFDNRQEEERTEDTEMPLENAWRVTERGIKRFTAFLKNSPPLHQEVMMEAHKERIRLTACIQNLQDRIRCSDISSKYRDIISKSTLIHSGCPAVYKLKPKEETLGSLKKFIVGEKNPNTPNKTILVVGETGTGKSTLIDALINHAMGVKFEDQVWFKVIEEGEKSESESQTSTVTVYQIFEGETLPYSLTIIDTPGYGDTRGKERDVTIRDQLFQLFQSEHGVHELHAVGLVLKAAENRLSDRLRYVFDSVLSLFGKDLEKNIVALCTHSNGMYPENVLKALEAAKIKCARDQRNDPVHFLFDNRQSEERSHPNNMKKLKRMFEDAEEEMNKLVKFMETVEPQRLDTTLDVITSRMCLAACIHNLQDRINQIDLKQREIRQTEEALKENKEELENDKNFTIEVDEVYKDKENIGDGKWLLGLFDGATCCTVCEENCHFPCTTAWYPSRCKVMSWGKCTVCTKKCPVSKHVKDQWRYVSKTRKVKKTLEEVKEKYEVKQEGMTGLLEALKQEKENLEKEKNQFMEEAYQHVMKLEEIALNVDSLSTSVNLELLVEKMKEKGETAKVQKLEKIMKRQDKGVLSVMKSWFGKVMSYK